jgi:hypothetical protein
MQMKDQDDTKGKDDGAPGKGGGGQDHDPKTVTIIVNTRRHEVDKNKEILFEEVVNLAYDNNPPTGPNVAFSVMYRRGHGNQDGTLTPEQTVKVKDGMIFDVTPTDRS